MKDCKRIYIEVYTDGDHKMMHLQADVPNPNEGTDREKERYLSNVSFYMSDSEVKQFANNGCCELADGYLILSGMFDTLRFTYVDWTNIRVKSGSMNVSYYIMEMPMQVRKIIARLCRKVWNHGTDGKRLRFEIDLKRAARWQAQYGQATGSCDIQISAEAIEQYQYAKYSFGIGEGSFYNAITHLERVAKNTTFKHSEVGTLKIYRDREGFLFYVLNPKGHCTMNGGIFNHSKDLKKPDWSTHT